MVDRTVDRSQAFRSPLQFGHAVKSRRRRVAETGRNQLIQARVWGQLSPLPLRAIESVLVCVLGFQLGDRDECLDAVHARHHRLLKTAVHAWEFVATQSGAVQFSTRSSLRRIALAAASPVVLSISAYIRVEPGPT